MRGRGSIGFGVVPSMEAAANRARFAELCELLSAAVGTLFFPYYGASYRDVMSSVERGDVGLAWLPPLLVLEAMDRKLAAPLAVPIRRGTTTFHSAILVRRNGPRSLAALKGLTAAWVDRESAAGYLVPRAHIAAASINPDTLFVRELFLKSHEATVDALVSGRADVCATYCTVEAGTHRILQGGWTSPDGTVVRPVDVLTTIGPIPNDGIVVSERISADVGALALHFLLSHVPRARELFRETLRADAFLPATATHYVALRNSIAFRGSIRPPPPAR